MGLNHQNPPGEALNRRSTVSSTCYLPNLITICQRDILIQNGLTYQLVHMQFTMTTQLMHDTYGNLYNWYAIDLETGVCPIGWHVSTDEEIKELEVYLV